MVSFYFITRVSVRSTLRWCNW